MKWEFLGKQDLLEAPQGMRGHTYLASMWRTPVPGGWLLMTLNTRSNGPDMVTSFYPDPNHVWNPSAPPESSYLLRAAGDQLAIEPPDDRLISDS
jgi:hypothetical protein